MSCAAACGQPAAVVVVTADVIAPMCARCALGVVLTGADGLRLRWLTGTGGGRPPAARPRGA